MIRKLRDLLANSKLKISLSYDKLRSPSKVLDPLKIKSSNIYSKELSDDPVKIYSKNTQTHIQQKRKVTFYTIWKTKQIHSYKIQRL